MPDQKQEEFLKLVGKYLDGNATPDELSLLDGYYELFRDEPEATAKLDDAQRAALEQRMEERLFVRIGETHKQPSVRRLWPRIAAAASILIAISIGGYFVLHQ
ncbi:MAG: hypothetical protein JST32_01460, partial [Bacteroidetes bacterium]|nr:hypothetical protein [Bacteroidota bacterium]